MPEWVDHLRPRLAPLRLSPEREAEIIEELSQHLDESYEELRRGGAGEADAQRQALEELLEPDTLANYMRPLRQAHVASPTPPGAPGRHIGSEFWQDLRYAARMLRKQPGFAAAAVLTLALGIGTNSAIFTLVDATLLRPLPFPDPERLMIVWERSQMSDRGRAAPSNLADWNQRSRTFEVIAGFVPNVGGMVMSGEDGVAETIPRQWVTSGYFDALGMKAIVGRTFLPSDDTQRATAIVLSEAFWRTSFASDPGIVGRRIRLDNEPWTVVGVVGNEARLLPTSIWALGSIQGAPPSARTQYSLMAMGRLKPGITVATAQADMTAIAEALAREFPKTNTGRGVMIEPLRDVAIGGDVRRTSTLFLGVVGFVLLICCANIANLLLARATVRARELSIRCALGAARARVIRQLLTESLLIAMIGGTLGLAVGAAIIEVAPSVIPQGLLPSAVTLSFDMRIVAFCAAAALLSGLFFGLAPAWQVTELGFTQALASDSRTTTGRGGRLRSMLVAGEIAVAVLLLFGAGLLLRTLLAVEGVDRGYRAEGVLTMTVDPHGSRYPTKASLLQFYNAVGQEVAALPGIRGVAWSTTLPLGRSYEGGRTLEIIGGPPLDESQRPTADYQIVSPAYFRTLDLPVVSGRGFDDRDTANSVSVCMVSEAFVHRYLQARSPVGARVAIRPTVSSHAAPVVREIVGVVRQVKRRPDETEDLFQIYVPLAQDTPGDIFMLVRPATGRAEAIAPSVRAAMARIDKEQLVSVRGVMTLEDIAWEATSRHRFRAMLVMTFAGLALLLAMVGVFGIIAYSVQRRAREFGVRRALGATTRDVLQTVIRSAVHVIGAGALIGLALSAVLSRMLDTILFGVKPLDLMTFAYVIILLVLTAAISIAAPAWRATRVDPASVLRQE